MTDILNMSKEDLIRLVTRQGARIESMAKRLDTHTKKASQQSRDIEALTMRVRILEGASDAR